MVGLARAPGGCLVTEIDWKRVAELIDRSERHSRDLFREGLTEDEWIYLGSASLKDRNRYIRVLGEVLDQLRKERGAV